MATVIYDRESQSSNRDGFRAELVRTMDRRTCQVTYTTLDWDALGHLRLGEPESVSTAWDREDPVPSEDGVIVLLGRYFSGLCSESSSSVSCNRFDSKTEEIRIHKDALGHASKVYVNDCIMWDREQSESSNGRGVDSTQDGFRLEVLHKATEPSESSSSSTASNPSCPPPERKCSDYVPLWKTLLYVDALGHLSYVELDDRNDMACGICVPCCNECVSSDLLLSVTLCTERDDCFVLEYEGANGGWRGVKNIPCGDGKERLQEVFLVCERFTTIGGTDCFFALYINGTRNALTVVGCCPFTATQSTTLGWDTCIGIETGCLVPCSSGEVVITERPDCEPYCDPTECPQSISSAP